VFLNQLDFVVVSRMIIYLMEWWKLILGGILLGISFGYVFPAAFGFIIQVCIIHEEWTNSFGDKITCESALSTLIDGMLTPIIFWLFVILVSIGIWMTISGLQSRSLVTMRKHG
jgi:hypothetical protein